MNVTEVPQDNDFLEEGRIRDVCYALDENGNYKQVLSLGWNPKNEAIKQSWDLIYERVEEVRQQVLQGKISPIAYYMEKNVMDTKILSQYTGFSRWRIKRHLKPKVFKKIKPSMLQVYADVFNISVCETMNV